MIIFVDRQGPERDISREIAKTESLLADLKRFAKLDFPTRQELEVAPLIDDYMIVPRMARALTGTVSDHPRLGSTPVMTTQLWAIAPSLGWARTWSRFYRLGSPSETPHKRD